MANHALEAHDRETRWKEAIIKKFGKNHESLIRVIEYYISLFPFSIAGQGVMSEKQMMSGEGRKRGTPSDSDGSSSSDGSVERVSKKQAMETLTTKLDDQHNEQMAYMRKRDDITRANEAIRYENEEKIRKESAESLKQFQGGFLQMFGDLIKKI
jgi:hypothetical protein